MKTRQLFLLPFLLWWVSTAISQPNQPFLYLSFNGGPKSSATSNRTPTNTLAALGLRGGQALSESVLEISRLHPTPMSMRGMILLEDNRLFSLSAKANYARLLVSDPLGHQVRVVLGENEDHDPFFRHPYSLAVTPAHSSNFKPNEQSRTFFITNQNTGSVTFNEVAEGTSHLIYRGLLFDNSSSPLLTNVRGIAYHSFSRCLFVSSKGRDSILLLNLTDIDLTELLNKTTPRPTPRIYASVSNPTALYIDEETDRLYAGLDSSQPAFVAFDLRQLLQEGDTQPVTYFRTPPEYSKQTALNGPSGIGVSNDTLYGASRFARSIFMWKASSGEFLGSLVQDLPDYPELLFIVSNPKFSFPAAFELSLSAQIAIAVIVGLALLMALIAVSIGIYRMTTIWLALEPVQLYQVLPTFETEETDNLF